METPCCSTNDAEETAGAKFHTSLNVTDLPRSITFYRLLLGRQPGAVPITPSSTTLNIHDWQALANSSVAGDFLLLANSA